MQATVTRDVILDLLPVYLAGEASLDTKKVVDDFAQTDPYIKRLLEAGDSFPTTVKNNIQPPDMEMETLKHTRSRMSKQVFHQALAIAGTFIALMSGWGGLALVTVFWVFYFLNRAKIHKFLYE